MQFTEDTYITPKKYCNQNIIHQSCSAPTIRHTKDANE